MRGFTLVELMIVIAILAFLIAMSVPLAMNFYKTRQLDVHLQEIVQALRRAQLKAMSVENDSSFGVYIGSGQYLIFKGSSYLNRDSAYDEVFDLPARLSVLGPSEVVFNRLKGIASATGTVTLTIDGQSETIEINKMGRINY